MEEFIMNTVDHGFCHALKPLHFMKTIYALVVLLDSYSV